MPTYQYRCTSCDSEQEVVQRFTDDPLTDCPECDGNLRKVFNAVGVVFKGSGFYATDNRPKNKAGAAKVSEKTGEKSEKSEKSESKPAAESKRKTEAKHSSSTGASSAA